jgi:DNA-binding response OmpR family regulator
VARVLVIAVDPNIEALIGQLLGHAGHHPTYDASLGAAGETIRRTRPDVVVLDTELPRTVVASCRAAAVEAGTSVILTSSSASEAELAAEARRAGCPYFALPGGPLTLRDVIDAALASRRAPRVDSALLESRSHFRADDQRL